MPLTTDEILSLLEAGPPRIAAVTDDLTQSQLQTAPSVDDWSANQVLAHLRSCADVWGECIARLLAEDHPTIRAINPRTWIRRTNYLELDFRDSLQSFTVQRAELLSVLRPLPRESWLRSGTVTGAGPVLERSVHAYAQWMATHERPHLKQIERLSTTPPA